MPRPHEKRRTPVRRLFIACAISVVCVVCQFAATSGCSTAPSGTMRIVTGPETDTFSRAPAPAKLRVDSVDASGKRRTLATAALPTSGLDLGSVDIGASGTVEVIGTAADGTQVVYGQSIALAFWVLEQTTVPVFVQRTGELARMPGPLSDARQSATLALLGGRFLFVGGGSDLVSARSMLLYDFFSLTQPSAPVNVPRIPKSIAVVGTVAWLIDDSGASGFDVTKNTSVEATSPAGGSFADVAGGSTVVATDGTQYVVGATRGAGPPTSTVLAIDPTGQLSWRFLAAPRLGAAATWVDGRGLVIAAGSATAAGVEVIGPGATTGSSLAYPADASTGTAASALDAQNVLLAGGVGPDGKDAGARALDLGCGAQCSPTVWTSLPQPLASAQAFASTATNALIVGDDPGGMTRVYRVTTTIATELPTKMPHTRARALISPLGSVVLFGGANEIESFVP